MKIDIETALQDHIKADRCTLSIAPFVNPWPIPNHNDREVILQIVGVGHSASVFLQAEQVEHLKNLLTSAFRWQTEKDHEEKDHEEKDHEAKGPDIEPAEEEAYGKSSAAELELGEVK